MVTFSAKQRRSSGEAYQLAKITLLNQLIYPLLKVCRHLRILEPKGLRCSICCLFQVVVNPPTWPRAPVFRHGTNHINCRFVPAIMDVIWIDLNVDRGIKLRKNFQWKYALIGKYFFHKDPAFQRTAICHSTNCVFTIQFLKWASAYAFVTPGQMDDIFLTRRERKNIEELLEERRSSGARQGIHLFKRHRQSRVGRIRLFLMTERHKKTCRNIN